MIGWILLAAFHFRLIALAVDIIYRRGPSNKRRHQLQPKKTKVRLLVFYIAAKDYLPVLHY